MSKLGNIFKRKLDQRQFEFNDEYWRNLEAQLDSLGKKGGGGHRKWYFYTTGIVVVFSFAVWFFYPGVQFEKKNIQSEKNDAATPSLESVPNDTKPGKKVSSEGLPESGGIPGKNDNQHQIKNTETADPIAQKTEVPFEKPVHAAGSEKVKKPEPGVNAEPGNKSDSFLKREEAMEKTALAATFVAEEKTAVPGKEVGETQQETTSKTESNSTSDGDIADSKTGRIDVSVSKKANDEISGPSESTSLMASAGAKNHLLFMEMLFPPALPGTINNIKEIAHTEKTDFLGKSSFFAGLYSGIMYTGKILKNKDGSLQEYLGRRNSEETGMLAANIGVDAGICFNRWNISTGLNFHQQGEMIDYRPEFYRWLKSSTSTWNVQDNSYWTMDTTGTYSILVSNGYWQSTNTTISYWNSSLQANVTDTISIQQYIVDTTYNQYFYVTDSNLILQFDSTEIVKIDSVNKITNDPALKPPKTTTKISYVEIPVLVGYEFPINRFTLMVRTGFSLGILSKFDAVYLKNDISGTGPVEISRQNKSMLNYLLRAGLLFNLNEHAAISFEPMFRMNINSVLKDSGYTQKYWNAGMNAGVVYRF